MPGTISRFVIQENGAFVTLDNGNEAAFRMTADALGGVGVAFYIRWHWDADFTPVGGFNIEAGDEAIAQDVITSANLWNTGSPTWAELLAGAEYVSPIDHQTFTGMQAVSKKFADWCVGHTTFEVETATMYQWFHDTLLVRLQGYADQVYSNLVTPDAPAPGPTASQQFPPQQNAIQSALGLLIADGTLLTASKDPTNGNRVIVGEASPPQA